VSLRRKSPVRKIESVTRVGIWGTYAYAHVLSCGHTAYRKRASLKALKCEKCYEPPADFENEVEVQVCKLNLASSLGCSPEDVNLNIDATNGPLRLQGAVVWLSAEQVQRLIRPRRASSQR
jgi:hypothetical protein